jgi:hypothetical protein
LGQNFILVQNLKNTKRDGENSKGKNDFRLCAFHVISSLGLLSLVKSPSGPKPLHALPDEGVDS